MDQGVLLKDIGLIKDLRISCDYHVAFICICLITSKVLYDLFALVVCSSSQVHTSISSRQASC